MWIQRIALVATLVGTIFSGRAEVTLTDTQGRKATVELTEVTPDTASFVLQGRKSAVKLSSLSEESRAAAIDYAKANNLYRSGPPLVVQLKVARQQHNSSDRLWYKNVRIGASVVIEGVNKLTPLPALEATIVLITQDTHEKYAKHVDKLKVALVDRIDIPAATVGTRRELEFKPLEISMDAARDASNLGGSEYKFYVFGLRDAETKQFLDFQTNCPSLQAHVAAHPEARASVLSARPNAPFSADFAER